MGTARATAARPRCTCEALCAPRVEVALIVDVATGAVHAGWDGGDGPPSPVAVAGAGDRDAAVVQAVFRLSGRGGTEVALLDGADWPPYCV